MVEAFCGANNVPEATCNLMQLALDEVLSNIVKYAYDPPGTGTIDVQLTYSTGQFMASVEDHGVAFDPVGFHAPVRNDPLQSRKEGGLGIFFVKRLLDGITYERVGDRNKVTLMIQVPPEQP